MPGWRRMRKERCAKGALEEESMPGWRRMRKERCAKGALEEESWKGSNASQAAFRTPNTRPLYKPASSRAMQSMQRDKNHARIIVEREDRQAIGCRRLSMLALRGFCRRCQRLTGHSRLVTRLGLDSVHPCCRLASAAGKLMIHAAVQLSPLLADNASSSVL